MTTRTSLVALTFLGLAFAGCSKSASLVPFTPEKSSQVAASPVPAPADRSPADVPAGSIQLSGIGLSQALTLYAAMTDAQLLTEPRVQTLSVSIGFTNHQDLTRAESIKSFEEALHQQAGLVFEHQDARHISIRLATNSVTR
jgi:hypothetical protein